MVMCRGLGGHTFTNVGEMPNGWTDRDQIWHPYAYSSGNGHALTNNRLIPEGHGGLGGIHSSIWETFQTTGPIGTKFGTCI